MSQTCPDRPRNSLTLPKNPEDSGCVSLDVHVTCLLGTQHRHAFALNTEPSPRLRTLRHLYARIGAIDRWHFKFPAQRSGDHGDRYSAVEIGAFPLKEQMSGNGEKNVEIAGRTAAYARLALSRQTDASPVLDTGRNVHG